MDSFEDSMLVHNIVSTFFLENCRAKTIGKTNIIVIMFAKKAYRANVKFVLRDLSCETPHNACDGSGVIWTPSDYLGISLTQAGEFHLDRMVRSPTLFPSDGCMQKQESKTWLIWIPMVISVTQ
jgi:hypothetical protein